MWRKEKMMPSKIKLKKKHGDMVQKTETGQLCMIAEAGDNKIPCNKKVNYMRCKGVSASGVVLAWDQGRGLSY